jgi:hypothetical protein
MTREEASNIVEEYRAVLEASGTALAIPISQLPYPKATIKEALIMDFLADEDTTAGHISSRYPLYREEYGWLTKWTEDPRAASLDIGESIDPQWSRDELRAVMELTLGFRDGRAALRAEFQNRVAERTGISRDELLRILNAYHAERIASETPGRG